MNHSINYFCESLGIDSTVPVNDIGDGNGYFIQDACYDIHAIYGDDGHYEFVMEMLKATNDQSAQFRFKNHDFVAVLV